MSSAVLGKVLGEWRNFFLPAACEHVLPLFLDGDKGRGSLSRGADASLDTAVAVAVQALPAKALRASMLAPIAQHFGSCNTAQQDAAFALVVRLVQRVTLHVDDTEAATAAASSADALDLSPLLARLVLPAGSTEAVERGVYLAWLAFCEYFQAVRPERRAELSAQLRAAGTVATLLASACAHIPNSCSGALVAEALCDQERAVCVWGASAAAAAAPAAAAATAASDTFTASSTITTTSTSSGSDYGMLIKLAVRVFHKAVCTVPALVRGWFDSDCTRQVGPYVG